MELSYFTVYIITQLNSISHFLITICILSIISSMIFIVLAFNTKLNPQYIKISKYCLLIFIVVLFINSILPSSKTAAAIYLLPKLVNNESVQQIGKDSIGILRQYTSQYLKDLKDDVVTPKDPRVPKKQTDKEEDI